MVYFKLNSFRRRTVNKAIEILDWGFHNAAADESMFEGEVAGGAEHILSFVQRSLYRDDILKARGYRKF